VTAVVVADEVSRWYGQVLGVNELSAEIGHGITGLLGPNGAGKSTFMKLVTGQMRPDRGRIAVLDRRPFADRRLYARLGYCPEQDALYDDLTGLDFVRLLLRLHGYGGAEARRRARAALDRVGLSDVAGRPCRTYSKGMRQRTKLAQAIAHEPELLVLDEPLAGMDPVVRGHMRDVIAEYRDAGTDVILSSHVLHEVEALTDKILLIHRGRILADGTVSEIRTLLDRHPRKVAFELRDARAFAVRLIGFPDVASVQLWPDGTRVLVETRDVDTFFARLPELVGRERPGIQAMESTDAGLEAVFDYLVG